MPVLSAERVEVSERQILEPESGQGVSMANPTLASAISLWYAGEPTQSRLP